MSVTATKTTDATGTTVMEASFSIAQAQTIFWTATYTGSPTDGHSFYLSQTSSSQADIPLTTSGQPNGSHFLSPGTYFISIKTFLMGPGFYTVKFDPTGNGANNGDPHITTVNGVKYDFQAAGEFVALRDGKGMEIQTRQTPVATVGSLLDPYSGLTVGVAVNTAVAARLGSHRVSFQFDQGALSPTSTLRLRVDGAIAAVPAAGLKLGLRQRISSAPGGAYRLDFPNGTILLITPGWWPQGATWYINLDALNTPASQGLMGIVAGRNWLPDLPNGSHSGPRPSSLPQRFNYLYHRFADAWRVSMGNSLFHYGHGQSAATFVDRAWPKTRAPFTLPGQVPVRGLSLEQANNACRFVRDRGLNRDCVFDVRVMGDPGIAKTYQRQEDLRRQVGAKVR